MGGGGEQAGRERERERTELSISAKMPRRVKETYTGIDLKLKLRFYGQTFSA